MVEPRSHLTFVEVEQVSEFLHKYKTSTQSHSTQALQYIAKGVKLWLRGGRSEGPTLKRV
jgi:hypothetical protein